MRMSETDPFYRLKPALVLETNELVICYHGTGWEYCIDLDNIECKDAIDWLANLATKTFITEIDIHAVADVLLATLQGHRFSPGMANLRMRKFHNTVPVFATWDDFRAAYAKVTP